MYVVQSTLRVLTNLAMCFSILRKIGSWLGASAGKGRRTRAMQFPQGSLAALRVAALAVELGLHTLS